jgi:predicted metal-dependent phosphotriesterase family hydrolase
MRPFVRTVLGDVAPSDLGVVLSHEHLIIDSPIVAELWPHIHLPSVAEAVAELSDCVRSGVGTVVDAMPIGGGGDVGRLAEISAATGAHIIASTGMHTAKYYPGDHWALTNSADELAKRFLDQIATGVAGARAGLIKVATAGSAPDIPERRLFEAAATTHVSVGVPLLTHCELGLGGFDQIQLLASLGVAPHRIALSHTDKVADVSYHRDLMETGALLCLDQGLRDPDRTAALVTRLVGLGFGSQLLIGTDAARRSLWSTLGGSPGMAWINGGFVDLLVERGLGREEVDRLLVSNPARWLTFSH